MSDGNEFQVCGAATENARTIQHSVAVIKPGCHDAACHCLGQVVRQQTADNMLVMVKKLCQYLTKLQARVLQ